jgi:hypothetical protein
VAFICKESYFDRPVGDSAMVKLPYCGYGYNALNKELVIGKPV